MIDTPFGTIVASRTCPKRAVYFMPREAAEAIMRIEAATTLPELLEETRRALAVLDNLDPKQFAAIKGLVP